MAALAVVSFVLAVAVPQTRSDSLTLDEALARARVSRPRVGIAAATVARARGAARVGLAIPNPASQFEADDFAPTRKITVTQSLAWWPRRSADASAGRAGIDRAAADSVQQIADLGRDVRRAFFGARAADELLRLVLEQAAFADSLTGIAQRRAAAGDISDLERDQVRQESARAHLAASQARQAARVARLEFARALAASTAPPLAAGRLDFGLDDRVLAASPSDINAVPAMRVAVADSVAADARLRSARIARVPVPGVLTGSEWGGATSGNQRNLILGATLPLPVWSQGNELVSETRATLALASAQLAEARLSVETQVRTAVVRAEETAARARFARDSLIPQAQQIRAGAVRLYESGRTSVVPVLDALRAERDITRTAIAELLLFQEARADLTALLGRWE